MADAKILDLVSHTLDQLPLAAEEANAGLDFHHDGRRIRSGFEDGDSGCELKAPGREPRERVSAPRLVGRQACEEQGCPQHRVARRAIGVTRSERSAPSGCGRGAPSPGQAQAAPAVVPPEAHVVPLRVDTGRRVPRRPARTPAAAESVLAGPGAAMTPTTRRVGLDQLLGDPQALG